MNHARLYLTDSHVLRGLMTWGPDGAPLDIRRLADLVGVSKSKIHALLSGERPSVTPEVAERICEVLDVRRNALFHDSLPTPTGVDTTRKEGAHREHERAFDAAPTRLIQELGEHDGPVEPDGRRPPR
jgi:plasmid maintenance system antidote protein VapI